jgi:peptidoglycan LD-endopeptidase LytH
MRWTTVVVACVVVVAAVVAGCSSPPEPAAAPASVQPPAARPPSVDPSPSPSPSASPSASALAYTFPVQAKNASYQRTHHDYPATDIFAACGTPVVAATDGVVLEVSRVDRFDPARPDGALKGGLFVSIRGDDGVRYYNAHFVELASGIDKGVRVGSGQRIGSVGRTGNASNVCHLHFGISPPCAEVGDWWVRRGVVWPWSYLDAWKAKEPKSPAPEVQRWRQDHGCPAAPYPGINGIWLSRDNADLIIAELQQLAASGDVQQRGDTGNSARG